MIITLYLKDPDGISDAAHDLAKESSLNVPAQIAESEYHAAYEEVINQLGPWVKDGEYVTVQIDTDTGETKVLKQ